MINTIAKGRWTADQVGQPKQGNEYAKYMIKNVIDMKELAAINLKLLLKVNLLYCTEINIQKCLNYCDIHGAAFFQLSLA